MNSIVLNRICIFLACVGVVVAGTLSMGHIFHVDVPCGGSKGCLNVALHPTSYWFNGLFGMSGGIPVAFFGLAMYLTVLGTAIWRTFAAPDRAKLLLNAGFAMTGAGVVISAWLQYVSIVVIKEFCIWCMSSAITVALLFLVHALQLQVEAPKAESARPKTDRLVIAGFAAALLIALGFQFYVLRHSRVIKADLTGLGQNAIEQLAPADLHYMGNPEAPITIVEFGDLACGMCRRMHPVLKDFISKSNGKVRWAYRHFPLFMTHPNSLRAALLGEFAAEHNKFWDYLEQSYALDEESIKEIEPYFGILTNMGLSVVEARSALENENSPAWNRVYRDLQAADRAGLRLTPIYFVLAPGEEPMIVPGGELIDYLSQNRFQKIIRGDGG